MAWKILLNEVEFLTQYPMVGVAISEASTGIPGYLFGEINAVTYVDNGRNCKTLVNFLVSRLQANAPFTSIKVLKLLLYLIKNGHEYMVEEVRIQEIALKQAMSFHGPPDDHHGNVFYEEIRKLAKELLHLVFTEKIVSEDTLSEPVQSLLTGYGSNANMAKMSGFGYSVKTQKSVSDIVSDGFTNFVEKLLPTTDKEVQVKQTSYLCHSLPQYKPLSIVRNDADSLPIFEETNISNTSSVPANITRKVKAHRPGRAGGGWEDSEEEEDDDDDDDNNAMSALKSENIRESSESSELSEINKLNIQPEWSSEHKIVEEFVTDEPLSKLENSNILSYCKRCLSLNCEKILLLLIEKLSEEKENIQLRALVFIEYLFFHDVISINYLSKLILSALKEVSETESIKPAVKLKAKKICLIIENLSTILLNHNTGP